MRCTQVIIASPAGITRAEQHCDKPATHQIGPKVFRDWFVCDECLERMRANHDGMAALAVRLEQR